jgi:hypothetical protein
LMRCTRQRSQARLTWLRLGLLKLRRFDDADELWSLSVAGMLRDSGCSYMQIRR